MNDNDCPFCYSLTVIFFFPLNVVKLIKLKKNFFKHFFPQITLISTTWNDHSDYSNIICAQRISFPIFLKTVWKWPIKYLCRLMFLRIVLKIHQSILKYKYFLFCEMRQFEHQITYTICISLKTYPLTNITEILLPWQQHLTSITLCVAVQYGSCYL